MLQYTKGKRNSGLVLWGDEYTLRGLHGLCMDLSDKSPVLDLEGLLPALAYDLRHAYQGTRMKKKITYGADEITLYGVDMFWPTFIIQVLLLRSSLSFTESSKMDQSYLYLIEGFLEEAIKGCLPKQAEAILSSCESINGIKERQVNDKLGGRVSYFFSLTATERSKQLPEIINSLGPMWDIIMNTLDNPRVIHCITPEVFMGHSWDTTELYDV